MEQRSKGKTERTMLVGVGTGYQTSEYMDESLKELRLLAKTAGAKIVGVLSQRVRTIHAGTYLGKGKLEDLAEMVKSKSVELVIFDNDLSPSQSANIEEAISCSVLDRTGLILDIFALHARTRESSIQVELAQMKYLLPRLRGQWTHLERQEGAIGTRGPGETQLETDRRAVRRRISKLEKDLNQIDAQTDVRRARRTGMKSVALVGYTNAGKSTLINALSGADTLVEDKLFATLDTTVRRVDMGEGDIILMSDTVGFIKKLPHNLVASFRSTLKETVSSDLLLHIVDASHRQFEQQMEAVMGVLEEIGVKETPILTVFNKTDAIESEGFLPSLGKIYPGSVCVSALEGDGLEDLLKAVRAILERGVVEKTVSLPMSKGDLIAEIYSIGKVTDTVQEDGEIRLTFRASAEAMARFMKKMSIRE